MKRLLQLCLFLLLAFPMFAQITGNGGGGVTFPLLAPSGGGPSAPPYAITGSANTGMYSSAAGILNFAANGTLRLQLGATTQVTGNFLPSVDNVDTLGGTANRWKVAYTKELGSGATGNDDLGGAITLASGSGSFTFLGTYTNSLICVCTDTSATATVVGCHASNTALTINGTGTDVINYICINKG